MEYLKFLLIGIIGGVVSGLLGVGGGIVMVPLLLYFTDINIKAATAISMVQVFFASSFGTLFNRLQGNIRLKYALYFGLSSMTFSFLGSFFTKYISDIVIKIIYLFAVLVAISLFFLRNSMREKEAAFNKSKLFKVVPIGALAGFIGGVLGVGGGFLYVPILVYFFDFSVHAAVGTSLAIVLFNSVPGVIGKILSVKFDVVIGIIVAIGAIGGSKIGTYLNKRTKPIIIKIIFILLLLAIIVRVLIDICYHFG